MNNWNLNPGAGGTTVTRMAWGQTLGSVGQTSYTAWGKTLSGYPYQSYAVYLVLGKHSTGSTAAQVREMEAVSRATLTATTGSVVQDGPGGAGRTDPVAYAPRGWDHVLGAWAVTVAGNQATVRLAPVARVERRLAAGLPPVAAGRGELVQVLVNLLANAADALDEAGRGPGRVVISAEAVPGGVRLAVEDDGVGLPPGEVAQLFEPFFTTKGTRGTGLGLAISRELAGRWGAQLAGEARAGGGARFTLVIRTAETAEAAEAVPPRP